MKKLKKALISFGIVTMFLMAVLTTSVSALQIKVYNLTSVAQAIGTDCSLTSYSNTGIFWVTDEYKPCCKYASCTSFTYNDSYHAFNTLDHACTEYLNNTSNISTASDHLLNIENVSKTIFYGEVYVGASKYTGKHERIWITRYITKAMEAND